MTPKTLAQRLVARHGKLPAIRKAHDRCDRYRQLVDDEWYVTRPFRWLVWTTVLAQLLGTTQAEVAASMSRRGRPMRSAA
jgi:hypothetical protein